MLWNRSCVVVVSVLEHSSANISAEISLAMLEKADQLLVDFEAISCCAGSLARPAGSS